MSLRLPLAIQRIPRWSSGSPTRPAQLRNSNAGSTQEFPMPLLVLPKSEFPAFPLVPASSKSTEIPSRLPLPPHLPKPASSSSTQLRLGIRIIHLRFQPLSPRLHLGPLTHQLCLGCMLPHLHLDPSSYHFRWAKSFPRLRLGQASNYTPVIHPFGYTRLRLPSSSTVVI